MGFSWLSWLVLQGSGSSRGRQRSPGGLARLCLGPRTTDGGRGEERANVKRERRLSAVSRQQVGAQREALDVRDHGMRRAVFLDRDGTLIEEVDYLSSPSQVRVLPGVPQALTGLRELGFLAVLVTNQSVIARGLLTEVGLEEVHAEMGRQLGQAPSAEVDAIYYCPHHPYAGNPPYRCICECRKPKPGLLIQAAADLDIDLRHSYMVGDKLSDLEAGWNAGCRSILVLTGYGKEVREQLRAPVLERIDHIADDLGDAAKWVAAQE